MELSPCNSSGVCNFEVAPRILENLWTPGILQYVYCRFYVLKKMRSIKDTTLINLTSVDTVKKLTWIF
jgi:hypothetical protein